MFAVHRIDEQLAKAMDRKVWLPSGGTLVDRTEAMTVVDVNTGKFTGSGGNLEQPSRATTSEAAEEIVRQLRLRDIGGIVVIDHRHGARSNRDLVLRRLTEAWPATARAPPGVEVTSLGLVQLTQRLGTGLIEAFSTACTRIAVGAASCCTVTRSTRRRPAGRGKLNPAAAVAAGPSRQAREEGRRAHRRVQVVKVPTHTPGEHPMFRRWRGQRPPRGRHRRVARGQECHDERDVTDEVDETELESTAFAGERDDESDSRTPTRISRAPTNPTRTPVRRGRGFR